MSKKPRFHRLDEHSNVYLLANGNSLRYGLATSVGPPYRKGLTAHKQLMRAQFQQGRGDLRLAPPRLLTDQASLVSAAQAGPPAQGAPVDVTDARSTRTQRRGEVRTEARRCQP